MKSVPQKSVEPIVADLVNGWLKAYGLDYKLEQEPLNPQIDKALEEYWSKAGGVAATVLTQSCFCGTAIWSIGQS